VKAKLEMAASHLILAAPLAAFAAQAMAKVPFWYVALGAPAAGIVVALIARSGFWGKCWWPRVPFWIPALLVLATFAVGMKVLPFLLEFENYTCPFMPPLDGKVGFIDFVYYYNNSSGLVTGFYLLGTFFSLWLWRRENAMRWVPFIFQQVTLAVFLILCESGSRVVDAPSQHTLIKNCIHYFLPPVAAMAAGPVAALIPVGWSLQRGLFAFFALIFAGSCLESVAKYQSKTGVFYLPNRSGVIQSQSRNTAVMANLFWERKSRVQLLIDEETGFGPIGDFAYYSPRTDFWVRGEGWVKPVAERATILDILENPAGSSGDAEVFVLTTVKGMEDLGRGSAYQLQEVERLEGAGWVLARVFSRSKN